jgi:hypothetical protein
MRQRAHDDALVHNDAYEISVHRHVAGAVQTRARRVGRGDDVARLKFYFL